MTRTVLLDEQAVTVEDDDATNNLRVFRWRVEREAIYQCATKGRRLRMRLFQDGTIKTGHLWRVTIDVKLGSTWFTACEISREPKSARQTGALLGMLGMSRKQAQKWAESIALEAMDQLA